MIFQFLHLITSSILSSTIHSLSPGLLSVCPIKKEKVYVHSQRSFNNYLQDPHSFSEEEPFHTPPFSSFTPDLLPSLCWPGLWTSGIWSGQTYVVPLRTRCNKVYSCIERSDDIDALSNPTYHLPAVMRICQRTLTCFSTNCVGVLQSAVPFSFYPQQRRWPYNSLQYLSWHPLSTFELTDTLKSFSHHI